MMPATLEKVPGWFFDTVVISNFVLADGLALLEERYRGRAYLTVEVLDEIATGITAGYGKLDNIHQSIANDVFTTVSLDHKERETYIKLLQNLGAGEASCIAAAQTQSAIVVTDDRMARITCQNLGVLYTGTVGILKAMCQDAVISSAEADKLLEKMISLGFYSPVRKIADLL